MRTIPTAKEKMVMKIYVRQGLFLKRDNIPHPLFSDIASTLTIENPAYKTAEKAGRWTGGLAKFLNYYEVRTNVSESRFGDEGDKFLVLPRGFLPSLLRLCKQYRIRWQLHDYTRTCELIDFNSNIRLRDWTFLYGFI